MIIVAENGNRVNIPIKVGHELQIAICYRHNVDGFFRAKDVFFERLDGDTIFPTTLIVTLCQQSVIKYLKFQETNLKEFKAPSDFFAHAHSCGFITETEIEKVYSELSFDMFTLFGEGRNLVGAQSGIKSDLAQDGKTFETLKARLLKKDKKTA